MNGAMKTIDVRGLEPPEPLERVLDALSTLEAGERLQVLIGREPHPLYAILQRNGYRHHTECRAPDLYEVQIWQAQPAT